MSTIYTRAAKGSALTWTEGDANITNLNNDKIEDIVEDTTPQLGGNLDVNGNKIVSTSNGNIAIEPNGTGIVTANKNIETTGDVKAKELHSTNSSGDEGGQINLAQAATNSTLGGDTVTVDIWQNRFRIFEQGGDARGVYIDLTAAAAGVGTNLLSGGGSGIDNVVEDTTPQLGGNLDVNGNSIVSASNGNISITPNGTGSVIIDGNAMPQDSGIADQVLITDGAGQTSWSVVKTVHSLVYNADSVTITKGQPVYLFGANGANPSVKLAANADDATSATTYGLANESIAAGATGEVVTQGLIKNVNTASYTEGAIVYLGASAGTLTTTKPYAPNHIVYLGVVTSVNSTSGRILVKVQNGYELDELHNVQITTTPSDGQVLAYETSSSLWKPRTNNLNGLSDVVITAAANGKLIQHNGTNWVDVSASSVNVGSADTATLATNATNATNVNIASIDGNTNDTSMYVALLANGTTGNQQLHLDGGLAYNASTNELTATTFSGALSGTATKATNLVGGNGTTLLGSLPYQSGTDTTSLLSPNTTTTNKFLTQVGDGTNGMAPMWSTISSLDNVTIGSITAAAGSFTTLTVKAGNDLRLSDSDSSNYVGFKAPTTVMANKVWTLPDSDGSNGQYLKTDGSGNLSFGTVSVSPAGSNTQVQYNNSGSFGASANLTWNNSTNTLSATTFSGALSGTATKATNLVGGNGTTLLGSIPYQSGTDTTSLLSPNTTTTQKFLTQVGDGTNGMAPMWSTIASLNNVIIGSTTAAAGTFTTLTVNAANDLRLADSDSSNYVGFKAPATVTTNKIWTLPAADGTNGQVLSTNGSGTLSWATAGGSGGSNIILLNTGGTTLAMPATANGTTTSNWTLVSSGGISGVSVSTTSFTLPAGTYMLEMPWAWVNNSSGTYGDMILRNTTDSSDTLTITAFAGPQTTVSGTNRVVIANQITTTFTIAASKTFTLRNDGVGPGSSYTWTVGAGRFTIKIHKTA